MNGKYNGRGLAEEDVDKLEREDDYKINKELKETKKNKRVAQLNMEINIIKFAPYLCAILFLIAFVTLCLTGQASSACTLTISTFTGVSGYFFGTKKLKKKVKQ